LRRPVLLQRRGPDSSRLLLGLESSCNAFPRAGSQSASSPGTELMTQSMGPFLTRRTDVSGYPFCTEKTFRKAGVP
jgi:hypothetical protein